MLFHGKQGVNVNQAQALQYYEIAADAGDANALYNMGVIHMKVECFAALYFSDWVRILSYILTLEIH